MATSQPKASSAARISQPALPRNSESIFLKSTRGRSVNCVADERTRASASAGPKSRESVLRPRTLPPVLSTMSLPTATIVSMPRRRNATAASHAPVRSSAITNASNILKAAGANFHNIHSSFIFVWRRKVRSQVGSIAAKTESDRLARSRKRRKKLIAERAAVRSQTPKAGEGGALHSGKDGAGDGNRTRNQQLGRL